MSFTRSPRLRAYLLSLLAVGGALPAAMIASTSEPVVAQESGLDPTEPPAPVAPVVRTPEDEARRAQVVVRVGEVTFTVGQIEDDIARQSPYMRARFRDRAALTEHVQTLVRFELIAREAERRGFGTDPEVRETTAQSAVQQMIRRDFDERITVESVPQADVDAYYNAHPEEFTRPEVRRASHIVFETQAAAMAALGELRAADARAFRQYAQDHSIDPDSRQRGGDLRYFDERGMTPNSADPAVAAPVVTATFAIANVGELGEPVEVGGRWSIVKLTGRRPSEHRSLEEAGPGIRLRLWRQTRQTALETFVETLRGRIPTEVHYERAANIRFEQPEQIQEGGHGRAEEEGEEIAPASAGEALEAVQAPEGAAAPQ